MDTSIKPIAVKSIKVEAAKVIVENLPGSSLIMHAWSAKVKKQMLDKMMKKNKQAPREAKNPVEEFVNAVHLINPADALILLERMKKLDPKPGDDVTEVFLPKDGKPIRVFFPSVGFKASCVDIANELGEKMTRIKKIIRIEGEENAEQIEIKFKRVLFREDPVTVGISGTDLRYRPELCDWTATLVVTWLANSVAIEGVLALINGGGWSCGIGEQRQSCKGTSGGFRIQAN